MFSNRIILKFITFFVFLSNIFVYSQVWYLFSHGLADTYKQAYRYSKTYKQEEKLHNNTRHLIKKPFITFNYPDASENFFHINRRETSLGQDKEIDCLKLNFEKTVKYANNKKSNNNDSNKIVIFGLSRGASAALNFIALYNPKQVKALVLESPFDSVGSIIDNQRKKLKLEWASHDTAERIMEAIFLRYNRKGIQSIDLVGNIRKDLPILIICSKEDQLVPWKSSVRLYKALKKSGHKAVHLFVANHGKHARILWDKNGNTYQSVVHAFYKKYNLPHNTTFALNGKNYLK